MSSSLSNSSTSKHQRSVRWSIWGLLVLSIGLYSCKDTSLTGNSLDNKPPKTKLTINEVNRSGSDRLSSQISVSWWGDDPDGYIIGYEYAFNSDTNSGDWNFTLKTDSVFILPIPVGEDTADVVFRVRAVDNDSLRDPVGANVIFPIKNTAPEIRFVATELPSDTSYSVFNFGWQVSDLDGASNINRVELQFNQSGNWISISPEESFVTVDITDDAQATATGNFYYGLNFRNANLSFDSFNINGDNQLMIRAVDNAGAESVIDTAFFYIKRKTSRILVLHDYAVATTKDSIKALHTRSLIQAGLSTFDLIEITDGDIQTGEKVALSTALPRVVDPTLVKLIKKWDFIYLFSSDLNRNVTYLQEMTTEFRSNGGKIFANIQMSKLNSTDPLFNFFPLSSFSPLPDSVDTNNDGKFDQPSNATNFRLPASRYAKGADATWDSLRIKRTLSGIAPMIPAAGAQALYNVKFQYQVPSFPRAINVEFSGSDVICVINGEQNIIYFSLDFNDVQIGSLNHLGPLIEDLCIGKLGFSSN
ncbi:hypothetical protein EP331_12785 [bacterium]|nr:MAG: hypothetical protein EP331_12785 [bacterium]